MGELLDYLQMDVAIGGGGPSGLTAGYYLAKPVLKWRCLRRNSVWVVECGVVE